MSDLRWTDDRCKQLDLLHTLLYEVEGINRATGFLQNIEKCIGIAEQLRKAELDTGVDSFITFLNREAIKNRQENKDKEK